jgi:KDO2-lipid IV(A) lauroyltransferase
VHSSDRTVCPKQISFGLMPAFRLGLWQKARTDAARIARAFGVSALRSLMRAVSVLPLRAVSSLAGNVMRVVGPWRSEHEIGRQNLAAAFPEKTSEELDRILAGVWTNLGRVAAEFAYLERLTEGFPERSRSIIFDSVTARRFVQLRDDKIGALVFSAHIGNWELPAIAARAAGLQTAVLYRPPSMRSIAHLVEEFRRPSMGELISTGLHAPFALARALEEGKHIGMLVDQHDGKGVPVTFFGRTCFANPLIALLARRHQVPIHGLRAKRLGAETFSIELTPPIAPIKEASGQIDVRATMQAITAEIEAWVRETPDQWLWLHRRWRLDAVKIRW